MRHCAASYRTCLPLALCLCAFVDLVFLAEQSVERCSSNVALDSALTNTPFIPDCCTLRQNPISLPFQRFGQQYLPFSSKTSWPVTRANSFVALSEAFLTARRRACSSPDIEWMRSQRGSQEGGISGGVSALRHQETERLAAIPRLTVRLHVWFAPCCADFLCCARSAFLQRHLFFYFVPFAAIERFVLR